MAAIFSDVGVDRRQFRDLVASRVADLVARVETAQAMLTGVGDQINGRVHTLGGHQRSRVAGMSRLSTGLPSTLDAATSFTLPAGETIGGRRLRRGRRILLAQRKLPFEIGDPFLLFRILLSKSFVFSPQALELLRLSSGFVDIGIRIRIRLARRPASRRHARYGTPIALTCTAP